MEYTEPDDCEDLLEGSDEEDAPPTTADTMLNVNDLDLGGDTEPSTSKSRSNQLLLDLMDVGPHSSDDEEDQDDTHREAANDQEAEAKREKIIKMLSLSAPGIDLFPVKDGEQNGFKYFDIASLSLEKDCEYNRRGKLLGHGFSNEQLNDILTDRFEFVRHLFPEAQSVLLCDKNDFKSIMNYLFYSISVCTNTRDSDLMTKAFFDLRRNYGFRWDLSMKHIVTVLSNFGVCNSRT